MGRVAHTEGCRCAGRRTSTRPARKARRTVTTTRAASPTTWAPRAAPSDQRAITGDSARKQPPPHPRKQIDDPWPIHLHRYGGYEDALFAQQVVRTVVEHDPTAPYFLFCKHCQPTDRDRIDGLKPDVSQLNRWRLVGCVAGAPHIVHAPLQVPPEFYHRFDFMAETDNAFQSRQTYRQPACLSLARSPCLRSCYEKHRFFLLLLLPPVCLCQSQSHALPAHVNRRDG